MQATVTNGSTASIGVTNLTFGGANPGDFSQTNSCGSKIVGKGSCTITVTFKPVATGARSSSLTITDSDPSSPQAVAVSGTGGTPGVSFLPISLSFLSQALNMASKPLSVTVTNTGTGPLNITGISIIGGSKGDFSATSTCPATVNPGATCTMAVTFTPSVLGTRTASVSIADNVTGSPQTIPLTGIGSALSITPSTFNFGGVSVGSVDTIVMTMQNLGSATITLLDHLFIGTNPGDFSETNTCGHAILGNSSCLITLTFTPSAKGARSAQLQIDDSDPSSPQLIPLTGTAQ
jgi:hypothetical protein